MLKIVESMRSGSLIFEYFVFQRYKLYNWRDLLQNVNQFMNIAINGEESINNLCKLHQWINCFRGWNKLQNCTGKSAILINALCFAYGKTFTLYELLLETGSTGSVI